MCVLCVRSDTERQMKDKNRLPIHNSWVIEVLVGYVAVVVDIENAIDRNEVKYLQITYIILDNM